MRDIYGVVGIEVLPQDGACRIARRLVGAERTEAADLCAQRVGTIAVDAIDAEAWCALHAGASDEAAVDENIAAFGRIYRSVMEWVYGEPRFLRAADATAWAVCAPWPAEEGARARIVDVHRRALAALPVAHAVLVPRGDGMDACAACACAAQRAIVWDAKRVLRDRLRGPRALLKQGLLETAAVASLARAWHDAAECAFDSWIAAVMDEAQVRARAVASPYRRMRGAYQLDPRGSYRVALDDLSARLSSEGWSCVLTGTLDLLARIVRARTGLPVDGEALTQHVLEERLCLTFAAATSDATAHGYPVLLEEAARDLPWPAVDPPGGFDLSCDDDGAWDDAYIDPALADMLARQRIEGVLIFEGLGVMQTQSFARDLADATLSYLDAHIEAAAQRGGTFMNLCFEPSQSACPYVEVPLGC